MSAHASLSRQLNLLLSTRIPLFAICHVSTITRNIYTCLNLTTRNVWLTNIYSMVGGIPVGLVLGPLCEQYGARILITLMCLWEAPFPVCVQVSSPIYMGKCADCCCNDMLDLY
jgi:nitrate/nitrite transporter NarK